MLKKLIFICNSILQETKLQTNIKWLLVSRCLRKLSKLTIVEIVEVAEEIYKDFKISLSWMNPIFKAYRCIKSFSKNLNINRFEYLNGILFILISLSSLLTFLESNILLNLIVWAHPVILVFIVYIAVTLSLVIVTSQFKIELTSLVFKTKANLYL